MTLHPTKTLSRIWRALPAQLSSVVSEEATLAQPRLEATWERVNKRYYAQLELVEPRVGKLWMVLELPLAIACAGKLMLRPNGAIRENIVSDTFDGDDLDAMGECVNTFCAAINEAVRGELGDDHRVVFRSGSLEPPSTDALGNLTVAMARLDLGGLAHGEFQLVVPDDVFATSQVSAEDEEDADADEDEDDENEDEDEEEADDDGEAEEAADESPSKKRRKPKKRRSKPAPRSSEAHEAADNDRPLLTPEEIAAIREATREGMSRGATMIVAPRASVRDQWRETFEGLEIEIEFVADHHQLLAACRTRHISAIVVDADACASGGLTVLAAVRGKASVPTCRVVVASKPTQTHLVACLGGGASDYLCRPLDPEELRRVLST